ncbi:MULTISPECIES: hypothetical protein [Gammaproteobacteria]|uniref:hypothetical protein n=1 Tax=Gammaproteobacteria TaxID=1236 RepID=UPI001ADBDD61|nr:MULTISPECIES: hypothetical protein [Gammaproteobacteria]MBO9483044.1 hypothetical protein [Salinisphaera sp. G21_0]MBO9494245.1 hypothetical protein [Thalassotalea sp. G20_0]
MDDINYTGEYDHGLTVGEDGDTQRDDDFKVHISQFREYRTKTWITYGPPRFARKSFPS